MLKKMEFPSALTLWRIFVYFRSLKLRTVPQPEDATASTPELVPVSVRSIGGRPWAGGEVYSAFR